ncbi:hypothetical protein ONS95_001107 [Cadophora gregata]|uniref:uncharacterized protein n=1 Tax=Cadophora gregata TaxID=51156 RepID=UPI0026DD8B8B|nr:uncharacterized protein ONS95_001107 [Cadophora gregata]KAK0129171.1 hypothetical protein ONS95_001107 [Cadophora gregata]
MYRQFQVPENSKSSLPATAPDKLMHKILHPSSILTPGPLKETFQWKQKARASSIEACTLPSSKHLTQQIIRRVFVSSLRSNWRIDRLMFCASWFGRTKSFCICILVPFFLFGFSIAFSSFLDTYTPLHFSFSWLIPFDSFSRAGSLSSHLTMTPKYNIPLRILQAVFSIVVLALSSYGTWITRRCSENTNQFSVAFIQNQTGYHSATQINFLIFVSSFSLLSLLFLELAPRFAPKVSNQYVQLFVQCLVGGLYLGGFIALSVFLGQLMYCQGSICTAAKVDAVFGAVSCTVWMASVATLGIEMSRFGRRYESSGESTEKVADKGVLV